MFIIKKCTDAISSLVKEFSKLKRKRKDEIIKIEKLFGPIDYLVPFYIIPDAQNLNPADFDEDDTGLVARNDVFDLLNRFLMGRERFSHAFILLLWFMSYVINNR